METPTLIPLSIELKTCNLRFFLKKFENCILITDALVCVAGVFIKRGLPLNMKTIIFFSMILSACYDPSSQNSPSQPTSRNTDGRKDTQNSSSSSNTVDRLLQAGDSEFREDPFTDDGSGSTNALEYCESLKRIEKISFKAKFQYVKQSILHTELDGNQHEKDIISEVINQAADLNATPVVIPEKTYALDGDKVRFFQRSGKGATANIKVDDYEGTSFLKPSPFRVVFVFKNDLKIDYTFEGEYEVTSQSGALVSNPVGAIDYKSSNGLTQERILDLESLNQDGDLSEVSFKDLQSIQLIRSNATIGVQPSGAGQVGGVDDIFQKNQPGFGEYKEDFDTLYYYEVENYVLERFEVYLNGLRKVYVNTAVNHQFAKWPYQHSTSGLSYTPKTTGLKTTLNDIRENQTFKAFIENFDRCE